jgi:hypothetical protein
MEAEPMGLVADLTVPIRERELKDASKSKF